MTYVLVWEFIVRDGSTKAFEHAYGPEGDWAKLFSHSPGHLRTELLRDARRERRYLTFDYWTTPEACEEFHQRNQTEYQRIDERCKHLTERETQVGTFVLQEPARRSTSA